mgnify:CR=1 FL=1
MRDLTNSISMDPGSNNPFTDDLFIDHPESLPGVARIHHHAFNRIAEAIEDLVVQSNDDSPANQIGRTILVTAPEAGYGKSHLAARLRDHIQLAATAISLPLDPSRQVAWPGVLTSTLRQFSQLSSSRNEGQSLFEETGRYLLGQLVINFLSIHETNDCPETEANLKDNFAELFSSDSPSSILNWADTKSRELSHEAHPDFVKRLGLTSTELGFWTRLIIDFNWRGDAALEPLRGLSSGEGRERLLQWLRIAAFHRPVLIVADGLDGFFQSETAGMEIAGILTDIREAVPRSVTLVCINNDVWESIFQHRLPSAWLDRLTGEPQKLRPIPPEAAAELIRLRLQRISLNPDAATGFINRLETEHLWVDAETKLSPRSVLRQGRDLWDRESRTYLNWVDSSDDGEAPSDEEPLSALTDKVDFFKALQEGRSPDSIVTPRQEATEPELSPEPSPSPGPIPFPFPAAPATNPSQRSAEIPENPFFAPAPLKDGDQLAGIDSIISDIRDSGKKVVSESPNGFETPPSPAPDTAPIPSGFQAGDIHVKSTRNGTATVSESPAVESPDLNFPNPFGVPETQEPVITLPLTRATIDAMLKERQQQILNSAPLQLELNRVEHFIHKMGDSYLGLNQKEERYPSSRTICLRWQVRGQSVLLGFESPKNVYFWNNLLQQSLSSNRHEKITAFSHASDSFDPGLFSSFGFSPRVIRGRIDAIELSDQELAVLYAAESVLGELENTSDGPTAAQFIAMHLDPLWRRISRTV